jgi:ankyrin repeat protein
LHSEDSSGGDGNSSFRGLCPLHFVSSLRHPNIENVKAILSAHPEAAEQIDQRGWMPLHYCAYNGRDSKVMKLLIKSNVDACFVATKKGCFFLSFCVYTLLNILLNILLIILLNILLNILLIFFFRKASVAVGGL